ncbi:6278_t:CDS:1, partial [Rhizophagus irregularis]
NTIYDKAQISQNVKNRIKIYYQTDYNEPTIKSILKQEYQGLEM